MPLITIRSYPPADPTVVPALLAAIRDAGAAALRGSPDNIWVVFEAIPPGWYVQGATAASSPQQGSHPPAVIIRAQIGRTKDERTALTAAVADEIARALAIPATNVWIHYQEMRSEDVWWKGGWSA